MLDKTIPYYNVLMKYDGPPLWGKPILPTGYKFAAYRDGDAQRWAQMEVDNNDFDTFENAVKYFTNKYLTYREKLEERFIGIRDLEDRLVGSVICWDDEKDGNTVSTVHWLVSDPGIQGRGIGTALAKMLVVRFSELGLLPIYLHTQPWSYPAIGIYSRIGFKLLRTDSFRGYVNQSEEALPVLKQYLTEQKYNKLVCEMID